MLSLLVNGIDQITATTGGITITNDLEILNGGDIKAATYLDLAIAGASQLTVTSDGITVTNDIAVQDGSTIGITGDPFSRLMEQIIMWN